MDQLDIAKTLEMRDRQHAIDSALSKAREPQQKIEGGAVLCIDCDSPIPAKRLAAKPNAARCITCQHRKEKR